jgi:hypothetical protein
MLLLLDIRLSALIYHLFSENFIYLLYGGLYSIMCFLYNEDLSSK